MKLVTERYFLSTQAAAFKGKITICDNGKVNVLVIA